MGLVTIQNTVKDAFGNPVANATVNITFVAGRSHINFDTTDSHEVYTSKKTIQADATGHWSADLTPNSQYKFAGSYYQVEEVITSTLSNTTPIIVPDNGGPYNLLNVSAYPVPVGAPYSIFSGATGPQGPQGIQGVPGTIARILTQGAAMTQRSDLNFGQNFTVTDDAVNNRTTVTHAQHVAATSAAVALIVKGAASQTANLQEWQDSGGSVVSSVSNTGTLTIPGTVSLNSTNHAAAGAASAADFYAPTSAMRGVVIHAAASQTANLQEWQNSSGSFLAGINYTGGFIGTRGLTISGGDPGYASYITADMHADTNPTIFGLLIKGAPGQTADLIRVENSAGATLAYTNNAGAFITTNALVPGNGTTTAGSLWGGSGAPLSTLGYSGDYYFRTDVPGTGSQRIYVKNGASWIGII